MTVLTRESCGGGCCGRAIARSRPVFLGFLRASGQEFRGRWRAPAEKRKKPRVFASFTRMPWVLWQGLTAALRLGSHALGDLLGFGNQLRQLGVRPEEKQRPFERSRGFSQPVVVLLPCECLKSMVWLDKTIKGVLHREVLPKGATDGR
jgi:hypothetical protein